MFIYILRNEINGKCYVGQDSGSTEKMTRVNKHFSLATKVAAGKKLKHESKLIPALVKYGQENFEVSIDSQDHKSKTDLDNAEIALIAKLDAVKNGYNILPGGQGLPSNASIKDDPVLLAALYEIRSRGAKTSNEKRWSNTSVEYRKAAGLSMLAGRSKPEWQKSIQRSWDNLSDDERKWRGQQMKDGRLFRFVLTINDHEIVETNLRLLLAHLSITPISKKQIEGLVRNENKFHCKEFKIDKRKYR